MADTPDTAHRMKSSGIEWIVRCACGFISTGGDAAEARRRYDDHRRSPAPPEGDTDG